MSAVVCQKIIEAWNTGLTAALEESERPSSLAEAEVLQDDVLVHLGVAAGGWKLGATNHASRVALGFDRPFSGLLPKANILANAATVDVSRWRQRGVECELAVMLRADVSPEIGRVWHPADMLALFGPLLPAFEIPQTRFATLATTEGPFALVADNGAAGYAVVGEADTAVNCTDAADIAVQLHVDGEQVATGDMTAFVARPDVLLADHVNRMSARGYSLAAGEYVFLGSLTPYCAVMGAAEIVADFGALGTVKVQYTEECLD